jgi:hypothetical protein
MVIHVTIIVKTFNEYPIKYIVPSTHNMDIVTGIIAIRPNIGFRYIKDNIIAARIKQTTVDTIWLSTKFSMIVKVISIVPVTMTDASP